VAVWLSPAAAVAHGGGGGGSVAATEVLPPAMLERGDPGLATFSTGAYSVGPASLAVSDAVGGGGNGGSSGPCGVGSSAGAGAGAACGSGRRYSVETGLVLGRHRLRVVTELRVLDVPLGSDGKQQQLSMQVEDVTVHTERRCGAFAEEEDVGPPAGRASMPPTGWSLASEPPASLLALRAATQQVREFVRVSGRYPPPPPLSSLGSVDTDDDDDHPSGGASESGGLGGGAACWPAHVTAALPGPPDARGTLSYYTLVDDHQVVQYGGTGVEGGEGGAGSGSGESRGFSLRAAAAREPSPTQLIPYSETFLVGSSDSGGDDDDGSTLHALLDDAWSEAHVDGGGAGGTAASGGGATMQAEGDMGQPVTRVQQHGQGQQKPQQGQSWQQRRGGGAAAATPSLMPRPVRPVRPGAASGAEEPGRPQGGSSALPCSDVWQPGSSSKSSGSRNSSGSSCSSNSNGSSKSSGSNQPSGHVNSASSAARGGGGRSGDGGPISGSGDGGTFDFLTGDEVSFGVSSPLWRDAAGDGGAAGGTAYYVPRRGYADEAAAWCQDGEVPPGDFTVNFALESYDDRLEDAEVAAAAAAAGASQAPQHGMGPSSPGPLPVVGSRVATAGAIASAAESALRAAGAQLDAALDPDAWAISRKGFVLSVRWLLWGGGEIAVKRKYDANGRLAAVHQHVYPPVSGVLPRSVR